MTKRLIHIILFYLFTIPLYGQNKPDLGTVHSFTLLAGSGLVNQENTEVVGNAGVYPGTLVNGLTAAMINGSLETASQPARRAQQDLAAAMAHLERLAHTENLSGEPLEDKTLQPGVYKFGGNATLDGELILDNGGDPEAIFVFQVNGDLTLAAESAISFSESAKPRIQNVFWQVKGNVLLGEGSSFRGSILARNNISAEGSTQVQGRLLTTGGQIQLTGNHISLPTDLSVTLTKSQGAAREEIYYIGETITFTLRAHNLGPVAGSQVRVRSPLPAGLTYVRSQASTAAFDPATATWTIGNLGSGETATLEITGTINAQATEFMTYSVSIAGLGMEEILSNNGSTLTGICVAPANPGTIQGPAVLCSRTTGHVYRVEPIPGVTSYNWMVTTSSGWAIVSGHNSPSITVRAGTGPGIITLTVGNVCASNTSQKSVGVSVGVPLQPGAFTAANDKPCTGQAGLLYSIPEVSGAATYTWNVPQGWTITAGQGTTAITVTAGQEAGSITVAAVNGCGTSPARSLAVTPLASTLPAPNRIDIQGSLCAGSNLDLQVTEIPGATTYNWVMPAGWVITSGAGTTKISVTVGTAAGEVAVAAANACTTGETTRTLLRPRGLVAVGAIRGAASPCALETTTYSVAPITGVTAYTWSLPAGWQLLNGQGTAVLTVAAGTSAGTLRVQASNECGEGPAARLEVTPSARVGAPGAITASSPVPCAGEKEIVYAIAPVANAAYYTWTVPADWTITGGQGTPSLTVTTTATAGEVTVKAGNACGESAVSSISAAPVAQVPAAPASMAGNFTPCASQREVIFTIAAVNNAASYLWQVPEGWVITQGQGTVSIGVTAGRAAGNISVKALNNCGAGQEMLRAVVPSLSPLATPQDLDGPVTVCAGERVSYSTPEIPGATLYTWQVPATWTILAGQGTTALEVLTGATGGTVGVQTTNSCGNSGVWTAAITVGPGKPAAPALITGTQDICAGTPGLAYHIAAVAGATTYAWTVPAGWIITGGQGTPAITVTAGRAAGYIAVSAANPCGSSPAATLAVNPAWPLPATLGPIAASSAVICQDQGQLVFQVAPLPGEAYYHWQLPAGWVLTGGAGTAAITVNAGKTGGSIRVKASNHCGESGISELPVQPLSFTPLALGTIAGNTIVCAGQPQLSYTVAPAAGAGTYTWTVPAGWLITAGQGTEKITVTAGPQPGSITVVAANSCTQSPPVALPIEKVFPAPPPAINDNSSVCAGLVYSIDKPADLTPANPDKKPSYTWQVPAGWTITQGQGSGRLSVVAPAGSKKGTITVVADNGNCHSAPITLVADPAIAEARLDIANAITANGDGANDTWDIKNLVNYPENEVVVFNRWGNEVYRRKGYHNDWNGGNLNAGTYFYQLKVKVCDGTMKAYQGYVMILR